MIFHLTPQKEPVVAFDISLPEMPSIALELQSWYFYFSVYDDDDDGDDNDDEHYPILTHKNPYMGKSAYGNLG